MCQKHPQGGMPNNFQQIWCGSVQGGLPSFTQNLEVGRENFPEFSKWGGTTKLSEIF